MKTDVGLHRVCLVAIILLVFGSGCRYEVEIVAPSPPSCDRTHIHEALWDISVDITSATQLAV
jgi:hypothetical protein